MDTGAMREMERGRGLGLQACRVGGPRPTKLLPGDPRPEWHGDLAAAAVDRTGRPPDESGPPPTLEPP